MNNLDLDLIARTFNRITPIIISDCQTSEKLVLLNELTARLEKSVFVKNVETPKKHFQLFFQN